MPSRVSENNALPAKLSQPSEKKAASASRTISASSARAVLVALAFLEVSSACEGSASRQPARVGSRPAGSCMAAVRVWGHTPHV